MKPHLRAHVLSSDEVALLGENERYALRGSVYAALVPLLDGTRNAEELVATLQDRFAPELVHYALLRLQSKGYAGTFSHGGDADARAWWSTHGITAEPRTGVCPVYLANARTYRPAFDNLRAALAQRHELRHSPEPDGIALVATSDYLDPRLAEAVRNALPASRWVLPARLGGMTLWLGPLIDRNGDERFTVLLRRLANNRPVDATVLRQGASFPLLAPQAVPEISALAAAWIFSALSAIGAGSPPPALVEGVLTLDPWTLETRRHPIVIAGAHVAPVRLNAGSGHAPVDLAPQPKRYTADGGHRTCLPHETLSRLEPFVGPIAGIVPVIDKVASPEGIHVYSAAQTFGASSWRCKHLLSRTSFASGKGATDLQARVSCLAEAVERYSCSYFADVPRRWARIDRLDEPATDPARLLNFSEAQYREREALNANHGGFNWIPSPFDPQREIEWTPAWSLTFQHTVWLPTAFCFYGYPHSADHAFCDADSNGCAAGNTLEEAILQGLLELVERDACALWWYSRVQRPIVDLASFSDPFFDTVVAQFDRRGRDLVVIDLTADMGIPVIAALSWRRTDGGRIHLGLGGHLEPRLAVSRAISELNQIANLDLTSSQEGKHDHDFESDHQRWLAHATIDNQPYLRPDEACVKRQADFQDCSTDDVSEDLRRCCARLRTHGLEIIVLEHTRADIGFPVARVVAPGLRHFWARLAPGRLYDVPVKLGWLNRPLGEAELNPIPFFF